MVERCSKNGKTVMNELVEILREQSSWYNWMMLTALVVLAFAQILHPRLCQHCFESTISTFERSYSNVSSFSALFLAFVFQLIMVSLSICQCWGGRMVSYGQFGMIVLIVLALNIVLIGLSVMVSYVFDIQTEFAIQMEQYISLGTAMCIVGYPFVLLAMNGILENVFPVIFGILMGIYGLAMILKLVRFYLRKLLSIVYILLFVVTLIVLPWGMVLTLSKMILLS